MHPEEKQAFAESVRRRRVEFLNRLPPFWISVDPDMAPDAAALLDLARAETPDCCLALHSHDPGPAIALYNVSGALPLAFEFPGGCRKFPCPFDEILDVGLAMLEEVLRYAMTWRYIPGRPSHNRLCLREVPAVRLTK